MMFHKGFVIALLSIIIGACGVGGNQGPTEEEPSIEEVDSGTTGFTTGGTTGSTTGSTTGGGLAPTLNCSATYCNLTAACESNSIRLNWGSDGRSGAYRILKRPEGGSNSQLDVSGTTYSDTSITRGTRYIYRVKFNPTSASNEAAAVCN